MVLKGGDSPLWTAALDVASQHKSEVYQEVASSKRTQVPEIQPTRRKPQWQPK